MRASIENWLIGHWYGGSRPPWYLRILEPLYRLAIRRSQRPGSAACRQQGPALPLIIVGNITAGGSGKTPLVIALCRIAVQAGLKPGIISKGYGRKSSATMLVRPDTEAEMCGDEPLLLALRTSVPVVVATDRARALHSLSTVGVDVVFSDDGLQQADLPRCMEVCVIDGARGIGNGYLIPAGPLREPAERLLQVDHVISNGHWADKPDELNVTVMQLLASKVYSIESEEVFCVDEFVRRHRGSPIHAVAGIGNPQRFFNMLDGFGLDVIPHGFRDHHAFKYRDFEAMLDGGAIVMTEKDVVKCRHLGLENAYYIPVETRLTEEFEKVFEKQLTALTKNRL